MKNRKPKTKREDANPLDSYGRKDEQTLLGALLPATGRRYDLWTPDDMSMQQVPELVAEAMQVVEPAFYRKTPDVALMCVATGQIQNPDVATAEIRLIDGDWFVLV